METNIATQAAAGAAVRRRAITAAGAVRTGAAHRHLAGVAEEAGAPGRKVLVDRLVEAAGGAGAGADKNHEVAFWRQSASSARGAGLVKLKYRRTICRAQPINSQWLPR